jgi:glucokinase
MAADSPLSNAEVDAHTVLVGDVGGTHARFALVDALGPPPWPIRSRLDASVEFATLSQALRSYVDHAGIARLPSVAVLAVAGPVADGSVTFTNRGWHTSEQELRGFGFSQALLLNDFAALALAADTLRGDNLRTIGPELSGVSGAPLSLVGPGTGFGVSCLVRCGSRAVALTTEAGHMGFAPAGGEEIEVLRVLTERFERVSVERVLSGPGLENLYQALAQVNGREAPEFTAPEISARAQDGDADCRAALELFCAIFGAVAGDIALAHGSLGGVFLAGGVAQKLAPILMQSQFRARFESKGRLSSFVESIPTRLILDSDAATLIGAARAGGELHEGAR